VEKLKEGKVELGERMRGGGSGRSGKGGLG